MYSDMPTLKGTLSGLSGGVATRWDQLKQVLEQHERERPHRQPDHPRLGVDPPGHRDGQGTVPLRESSRQRVDGHGSDHGLPWHQIARDALSVGGALRPPGREAAGRSVDDNYDIYRPVDFPSVPGGQ